MADEKKPSIQTADEKAQTNRQKREQRIQDNVVDSTSKEKPEQSVEVSSEEDNQRVREEALKAQEEEGRQNREASETVYVNPNGQIIDDFGTFATPDENEFGGTIAGNREKRRAMEEGRRAKAIQDFERQQQEEEQKKANEQNK